MAWARVFPAGSTRPPDVAPHSSAARRTFVHTRRVAVGRYYTVYRIRHSRVLYRAVCELSVSKLEGFVPRSQFARHLLQFAQLQYRRVAALAYTCTLQKLQIGRVHAVPGTRPAAAVGTLSERCPRTEQVGGCAVLQTACRSELPDRRSCGHKLGAALYAATSSAAGSSTDGLLGLVGTVCAISGWARWLGELLRFSTLEMSHLPIGWLKVLAWYSMPSRVVTWDVVHPEMSSLKVLHAVLQPYFSM